MKKLLIFIFLFFSVFCFFGCNNPPVVHVPPTNPPGNDETINVLNKEDLTLTNDLINMFKKAYVKSIEFKVENVDEDNINILKYYGKINDAFIVSINSNYSEVYPNDIYSDEISGMIFRYDRYHVYIIYNDKLYTAKEAYEQNIIDLNALCVVFGIHTSGLETFNEKDYNAVKGYINNKFKDSADLYDISKYYGKYDGYTAVTLSYKGMQSAVVFEESVNHLTFSYGYHSSCIRLINNENMYFLNEAYNNNIINNDDLCNLFELHTKSEDISNDLINVLLAKPYALCLKYKEGFDREITYDLISLTHYYGKYDDSYIFALSGPYYFKNSSSSPTEEELEIMNFGFDYFAYVLNNDKLYTIDQAVKLGIVSNELRNEIFLKRY